MPAKAVKQLPGRILIVDDEPNIRRGLRAVLGRDGHKVVDVASGEEALRELTSFDCEAAIVDISMPGMSGIDLLHAVRRKYPWLAVVLLTGHGTLESAMTAVREGAFDYALKPAQPADLRKTIARALDESRRQRQEAQLIEALRGGLRRLDNLGNQEGAPAPEAPPDIQLGAMRIDRRAHRVLMGGRPAALTPTEYDLLLTLARSPGAVIGYVELVRAALAYEAELWEAKELIKRHVFGLRQKIEPDPSTPSYVLNVRGVGYRLAAPEEIAINNITTHRS